MNQPLYQQIDPARDPRVGPGSDPPGEFPPERRSWGGWILVVAVAAVIVVTGAFLLTGGAADPIEEVAVAEVTEDGQAAAPPDDGSVSLSGEVEEILTESALTVTDESSEEPLLVLLTPATIVNGSAVTLGGQPGGIAQFIPPEGSLQLVGSIDTFESVALAERLGIVLNDELFAAWEGDPVLIAEQVETFDVDAGLAADTGLESE